MGHHIYAEQTVLASVRYVDKANSGEPSFYLRGPIGVRHIQLMFYRHAKTNMFGSFLLLTKTFALPTPVSCVHSPYFNCVYAVLGFGCYGNYLKHTRYFLCGHSHWKFTFGGLIRPIYGQLA